MVLQHFVPSPLAGEHPTARPAPFEELTPRELAVLSLMAHGGRNREIAEALMISEKTVDNHISNELQVADRTQPVIRAREAGLG